MTIANGISTDSRTALQRWRQWRKPGDIIRSIVAPVEAHQLIQEGLHEGQLFLLERIMNGADIAHIQSFKRTLILIDEETFLDLIR